MEIINVYVQAIALSKADIKILNQYHNKKLILKNVKTKNLFRIKIGNSCNLNITVY